MTPRGVAGWVRVESQVQGRYWGLASRAIARATCHRGSKLCHLLQPQAAGLRSQTPDRGLQSGKAEKPCPNLFCRTVIMK